MFEAATGHLMYVLECADGTLYTGYTVDVDQRVAAHNAGCGAKYTKSRRPVRLLAFAAFDTKREAMGAEFRFKQLSRIEKLAMVECAGDGADFAAMLRERLMLGDHEGGRGD